MSLLPHSLLQPWGINENRLIVTSRLVGGLGGFSFVVQLLHELGSDLLASLVPPLSLSSGLDLEVVHVVSDLVVDRHLVGGLENSLAPVRGKSISL